MVSLGIRTSVCSSISLSKASKYLRPPEGILMEVEEYSPWEQRIANQRYTVCLHKELTLSLGFTPYLKLQKSKRKVPESTEMNLGHSEMIGSQSQCLWEDFALGLQAVHPMALLLPPLTCTPCILLLEKGDYSRHQWHNGAIGIHHARSGAEGQPKWQGTVHSHKRLEAFSLIFSLLRMIERLVFGSLVMCSLQLLCLKDTSMRNLWELRFLCFITGSYTTKVSLPLPRERSNVLQQEASFCLSLMSVVWWSSQC